MRKFVHWHFLPGSLPLRGRILKFPSRLTHEKTIG